MIILIYTYLILSFFPSFLPSTFLMCCVILLTPIWIKGTPFEAMTGHTASSSDGLLAEVFLNLMVHSLRDHFIITLVISDLTDLTFGASVLWLGI